MIREIAQKDVNTKTQKFTPPPWSALAQPPCLCGHIISKNPKFALKSTDVRIWRTL